MSTRKETDLYTPVKEFLQGQGYDVKGEVKGCDLVAVRGDDLVVVELKKGFNVTLLLQGVERQAMTDLVYLAVEAPGGRTRWREYTGLCRRLGLGLLGVRFLRSGPQVEVACDPGPYQPRKMPKRRQALLSEFTRRSGDYNTGGTTKRKLLTAYREEAILLARALDSAGGEASTKALRTATGLSHAARILYDNYYGWYTRADKATYRLTDQGREAIAAYSFVGETPPTAPR